MMANREDIFTNIYNTHHWASRVSLSGAGSDLEETVVIRTELPRLIKSLGIKTMLDSPCGDFNWMKELDLPVQYTGMDVVHDMISLNNHLYGSEKVQFIFGDIVTDEIPKVDLILCRDCLAHLPFADIKAVIRRFKESGSTYLMATTFTECRSNQDGAVGGYRPINLQIGPFDLPAPKSFIDEQTQADWVKSGPDKKKLGVWNLQQLELSWG
jgi:SAM-dependent methyltransferase